MAAEVVAVTGVEAVEAGAAGAAAAAVAPPPVPLDREDRRASNWTASSHLWIQTPAATGTTTIEREGRGGW